jgi:hypothetical protein
MLSRHIRSCTPVTLRSRPFSRSIPLASNSKPPHTPDSYNKDVDFTPPPDPSIHRVDPTSDSVQKPHEAPSGEWSRAGTRTKEYQSVDKTGQPYAAPGGGKELYAKEKGPAISQRGKGPEGKTSSGKKPEGI